MRYIARVCVYVALLSFVFVQWSCSSFGSGSKPLEMGEIVQVGGLMYTVSDAEWTDTIGEGQKAPVNKYVLVRLSIKNESNNPVSIPLLTLEDQNGRQIMETAEGAGVDSWLGLLREIEPGDTIQGRIIFDARPADYMLQVTDGGPPESERTALVNIPLKLRDRTPLPGLQPEVPGGDLSQH